MAVSQLIQGWTKLHFLQQVIAAHYAADTLMPRPFAMGFFFLDVHLTERSSFFSGVADSFLPRFFGAFALRGAVLAVCS